MLEVIDYFLNILVGFWGFQGILMGAKVEAYGRMGIWWGRVGKGREGWGRVIDGLLWVVSFILFYFCWEYLLINCFGSICRYLPS